MHVLVKGRDIWQMCSTIRQETFFCLFVWTYSLQIVCGFLDGIRIKQFGIWILIGGEGGEWGKGINSIQIFVELQNRTVCNNVNMPVEIMETVAKIKNQNSFYGFLYQDFFFLLKAQLSKSIPFLFCFTLLRKNKLVPTFHIVVFT